MALKIKLPEKEWFTFEEIAARWQVDVATVAHYVWDLHLLRPAYVVKEMSLRGLEPLFGSDTEQTEKYSSWALSYSLTRSSGDKYNEKFIYILPGMIDQNTSDIESFPLFSHAITLLPEHGSPDDYGTIHFDSETNCLADFQNEPLYLEVTASIDGKSFDPCLPGIPVSNKYFITREERDRFEKEHSENEIKVTGKAQEENTLYALGIMAMLLAEKSGTFKVGNRPNAEQIAKAVNEIADKHGLTDTSLKALHKKIAEGLRQVKKAADGVQ
jgi:hypothetical protein